MATKADIVQKYAVAPAAKRVEIICKNYQNFEGIIEGKIAAMSFVITEEKAYYRKQEHGDLGVRVQSSGHYDDITANTAINELSIKKAIMECDFSDGILEGTDHEEDFIYDACTLMKMRREYELFKSQMAYLNEKERQLFTTFLSKKKTIDDLAEELGVQYHSVVRRMNKLKQVVKAETIKAIEMGRK